MDDEVPGTPDRRSQDAQVAEEMVRAGVSEDGQWSPTTVGTPQGAVISPLLKSRLREIRTYGSVRGAASNGRPYRDKQDAGPSGLPPLTLQVAGRDLLFSSWDRLRRILAKCWWNVVESVRRVRYDHTHNDRIHNDHLGQF